MPCCSNTGRGSIDGAGHAHCACAHDSPLVGAWKKQRRLLVKRLERYRQHHPAVAREDTPPLAVQGEASKVVRLPPLDGDAGSPGSAPTSVTFWNPLRAALPKVGSLQNAGHKPGGGNVTIYSEWPSWTASAKVGSLENARHVPGGGRRRHGQTVVSRRASDGVTYVQVDELSGGGRVVTQTTSLAAVKAKVGSLDNRDHLPGGGHAVIFSETPQWTSRSKVDSLSNIHHVPAANFVTNSQYLSPLRRRLKLIKQRLVWTHGRQLSPLPADVTL